jgi:hypothetical protein
VFDIQRNAIDGSEIAETLGDIFKSKNVLHRRVADRLR